MLSIIYHIRVLMFVYSLGAIKRAEPLLISCIPFDRKETRSTALLWPWKERMALQQKRTAQTALMAGNIFRRGCTRNMGP